MIILVDMDGTLVDFDGGLLAAWRKKYPEEYFVPLEERRSFHPHKDYPERLQQKVIDLCHTVGFVRSLPPMPGGIEAVQSLLEDGHDVRFCTSHLTGYDPCVLEKYQWIDDHFGTEAVDRIILTRDKTLIRGDILIDDKPVIAGSVKPTWEHIIYDRPHNRDRIDRRRLTWDDWREVLFATG
jgi:5'-nucleotidase